jgi:CBS domain-containing protein
MLIDHVLLETNGRQLISIGPDASVREALYLLVMHKIGSLPVLDSSGNLVGIFTERDVLLGECGDSERFHRQMIKEVMTRDPISCTTTDSVHEAMDKMSRNNVGQLPVMEEEKVVGLVSVADLIKSLHSQSEAEKEHLMAYIHGPTAESAISDGQAPEPETKLESS